jgi:hexosaminidase
MSPPASSRAPLFSSFGRTGLHVDLRVQVMPMPSLRALAGDVADLGFNTLLVEWEATYPFEKHPLISSALSYTTDEVSGFLAHCAKLGLDVIPLQQSFGHVEYILRHERYAHLRESHTDLCQLCPCQADEALHLFGELFAEIAAAHPSPYLHIGGDETYLLGHCPACRARAAKAGVSRLYVDYFKRVADLVVKLGKRPLLWADMLLKHPEAAARMPRECVFIDWNYGWPVNRFGNLSRIDRTRHELWGAPALRSAPDNHSLACWRTHFGNLRDFIPHGRRAAYSGMILTSWSTSGIYGHTWDKPGELLDLAPVRRVYPLAGFRILVAAFRAALDSRGPLDPRRFVIGYARARFGLSPRDGARLWSALALDATPLDRDVDFAAVLRRAKRSRDILRRLRPRQNKPEFAHLVLMADLREFHARFKAWEAHLQSPAFTARALPAARARGSALLAESGRLARRFERLNRGTLHPAELAAEHDFRFGKLRRLHARLRRRRTAS